VTTGYSPLSLLKRQADRMAKMLKALSRGEVVTEDRGGRIAASRATGAFRFGIVMDDKVIPVDIAWKKIEETSEVALAAWILKQMRSFKDTHH
jgi:hypothetical protein